MKGGFANGYGGKGQGDAHWGADPWGGKAYGMFAKSGGECDSWYGGDGFSGKGWDAPGWGMDFGEGAKACGKDGKGWGAEGWGGECGKGGCKAGQAWGKSAASKAGGKSAPSAGPKGDAKGGKGKVAQKLAQGEVLYSGRLKFFTPEKKHGKIMCKEIIAQSCQEVYAYENVLQDAGAGPGDLLAFLVHWSSRGQPQASMPIARLSAGSDGEYALSGRFKPGKDEKGFGFFECQATKAFFGRDVYVNSDIAATFTPGQPVKFNCYLNRDGMPNADAAEACDESWEPTPGDLSQSFDLPDGKGDYGPPANGCKGKGGGCKGKGGDDGMLWIPNGANPMEIMAALMKAKGKAGKFAGKGEWGKDNFKGKDAWGKSDGAGKGGKFAGCGNKRPRPESMGRFCQGTVKSFSQSNNYGFISCDEVHAEFGGDTFVAGEDLEGIAVGTAVQFELCINAREKPQAINVTVASDYDHAGEPPAKMQRGAAAPADDEMEDMLTQLGLGADMEQQWS